MNDIIAAVRRYLTEIADPQLAESGQRFFKNSTKMYGTKTAEVEKFAKATFKQVISLPKSDIFDLCDTLWQSGYLEESFIACNWSYSLRSHYQPEDIDRFEQWVQSYVSNWASCDTLCNHSIGTLVDTFPSQLPRLISWAKSNHIWSKRAAAVTLIIPAKHGKFLPEIFQIADILLHDSEDLVQKGYGWMLKAASQAHQQAVFDYVMQHKNTMPRTALRYAIEKMPLEMKRTAISK